MIRWPSPGAAHCSWLLAPAPVIELVAALARERTDICIRIVIHQQQLPATLIGNGLRVFYASDACAHITFYLPYLILFWEHVQWHVIVIRFVGSKYLSFFSKNFMFDFHKVHVFVY